MVFWFFFLIWKTVLFKYGLIGPLLKEFGSPLLLLTVNLAFIVIERIARIVCLALFA